MGDEVKNIDITVGQDAGGFSSQEYQTFERGDFPDGNVADKLRLDQPDTPLTESDIPEGSYYIEDFPFTMVVGDDLKEGGPRPVQIATASKDNGLIDANDAYTQTPFSEGERVAFLGQYNIPISVETLRDLLIEERTEKPATPADVSITEDELTPKKS